jgi:hypothetical protein
LYRSHLRFFVGKLLSKWEGPFIIEEVYRSGAIKIASLKDNTTQVVNGQRLKHYIFGDSYNEDIDVIQVVTPCNILGCEARNRENTEVCIAFMHRKSGKFLRF